MSSLIFTILIAVFCWNSASSEFVCPNRSGYYPDPEQCDLYYECRDGEATAKLCKDGMVFQDNNPLYQRCDYPFAVNCGKRTYLQPAQPSPNCPRRNGLFPNENSRQCKGFWQCVDGVASKMSCQTGLAFNPKMGNCQWNYLVPNCGKTRTEAAAPVDTL